MYSLKITSLKALLTKGRGPVSSVLLTLSGKEDKTLLGAFLVEKASCDLFFLSEGHVQRYRCYFKWRAPLPQHAWVTVRGRGVEGRMDPGAGDWQAGDGKPTHQQGWACLDPSNTADRFPVTSKAWSATSSDAQFPTWKSKRVSQKLPTRALGWGSPTKLFSWAPRVLFYWLFWICWQYFKNWKVSHKNSGIESLLKKREGLVTPDGCFHQLNWDAPLPTPQEAPRFARAPPTGCGRPSSTGVPPASSWREMTAVKLSQ